MVSFFVRFGVRSRLDLVLYQREPTSTGSDFPSLLLCFSFSLEFVCMRQLKRLHRVFVDHYLQIAVDSSGLYLLFSDTF